MTDQFDGAKLALIHGQSVVTILRDDRPDIPWPDMWDLAGGGREGTERPEETALREAEEELDLRLSEDRLIWSHLEERDDGLSVWFFVAKISAPELAGLRLGSEGQSWRLMAVDEFLEHPNAIPSLKRRLRLYLDHMS